MPEHAENVCQLLRREQRAAPRSAPAPGPGPPPPQGRTFSAEWNETAREAHAVFRQANKIWSTIHSLVHNTDDPMSAQQVAASKALAIWLRQHIMCAAPR